MCYLLILISNFINDDNGCVKDDDDNAIDTEDKLIIDSSFSVWLSKMESM